MTPLDAAHAAMEADPEDAAARLHFYGRVVEAELFLLLEAPAAGDRVEPRVLQTDDGPLVLAFDLEERLADLTGGPADVVAVSGRALVEMLAGQGLGVGLNLTAPSAHVLPPEAVDWLAEAPAPSVRAGRIGAVAAPRALPPGLVAALDAKLRAMIGRATTAYLAEADGPLLAFVAAPPGAEAALVRAVGEAVRFSGVEEGALDVAFVAPGTPLAAALERAGLKIDLTPQAPDPPSPPGTAGPPRLR